MLTFGHLGWSFGHNYQLHHRNVQFLSPGTKRKQYESPTTLGKLSVWLPNSSQYFNCTQEFPLLSLEFLSAKMVHLHYIPEHSSLVMNKEYWAEYAALYQLTWKSTYFY